MKLRSTAVIVLALLGVLTSSSAATAAPSTRSGDTWTRIPTTAVERVEYRTVTVPAQRAWLDGANKTLRVTIQYGGCDRSPRVQVVQSTRGVVTIRASIARPKNRDLVCAQQIKEAQLTLPVYAGVRQVIDQASGKNILAGLVMPLPRR